MPQADAGRPVLSCECSPAPCSAPDSSTPRPPRRCCTCPCPAFLGHAQPQADLPGRPIAVVGLPRAHTRRSPTDGLQRRLRTNQQTVFGGRKSPPRRSRTMPVCTHCAQRYQRFVGLVGVFGPVPYCDRLRSAECTYSVRVPLRLPPLCVSPRPSVRRALPTACRRGPAPPVAIDQTTARCSGCNAVPSAATDRSPLQTVAAIATQCGQHADSAAAV